jgi:hypothetical protein
MRPMISRAVTRRAATRCVLFALLICAGAFAARAQADLPERQIQAAPGRDTRVAIFTNIRPDCTSGRLPAIRLAVAPSHGAVNVRRGTLKATNFKQCLATEVPAFIAFYRSADEFSGSDEFVLEVTFEGGRKQAQQFRISVSTHPVSRQGI